MAYYAVGDIQGCYDPLARLLEQVNFDPSIDTLWCVGDMVNRGPKSLKTIRLLKSLEKQCVTVLGNHDIHLLAMLYGVREPRPGDTLKKILNAPDASEIADWLRNRPLLAVDPKRKLVMSHAGIYPWWTLEQAQERALDVEKVFQKEYKCIKLLHQIYSNTPSRWSDDLGKVQRRRFTINSFTRMRFCSPKGHLNLVESGFSGKRRKNRLPWFEYDNPSLIDYRVIFGHWSALGLLNTGDFLGLDTGCVWGKDLTMAKIPKTKNQSVTIYQQPNQLGTTA
ncbi:symmetrical bis(5'-nucleosyl)-tetraphosphatase [Arenicella xantha]|uniref:bis(5'-nucleosyl)-tetraphosphatase (symmetrical) n=1 Tax=Arenicella xantha TaxID=644221 RepID=A0A395JT82_9GAMM|nr:symmetrical bis(5'-nucleosyl)-tetraphosphatase [Arenicella xantha]RBP53755.1 bis(5'nucleosyl)-tetraphosphatase ApaH [Arenicella xantha]